MLGFAIRVFASGLIITSVAQLAPKLPRVGALILSLPLVTIGAFIMTWHQDKNLSVISRLAHDTLILVPLGLLFFVPLAYAEKLGIRFWPAFLIGISLTILATVTWFWLTSTD